VLVAGFPALAQGTNCWIVAVGAGEQCLVIDPGVGVTDRLDEIIAEHRLHPVAVVLTHGHLDHTFSVIPVCQARGVPAYIHPSDRGQLTDPWSALGLPVGLPLFGRGSLSFAEPDDVRELADGQKLSIAGVDLAVTHAPGHTPGSVVFGLADQNRPVVFSGDVLFAGSIGRTDLDGGDLDTLIESIALLMRELPPETVVAPGHGPATTLERELGSNPFLERLR
jgi:glyoxylase-like metal-dependent hydrolase (beta-lactamase superfamily II)